MPAFRLTLALLCAALCPICAAAAEAAGYPIIRRIAFSGNHVTKPVTMQRELLIREGDPADPALIERSRQAILDLGLFLDVEAQVLPDLDAVIVLFIVREKWYVLPIPRIEANTDEEFGLGMQLRWSNVAGLNHSLSMLGVRRRLSEAERSEETVWGIAYQAPFIANTPYALSVRLGQSRSPVDDGLRQYAERESRVSLLVSRNVSDGPASQGWRLSAGLDWRGQDTAGPLAPPRDGNATALDLRARYRDVRFNVYSETGRFFAVALATASPDIASDYGYTRAEAVYDQAWHVGATPHQTARLFGHIGSYHGGPRGHQEFSTGGSSMLRGYPADFRRGNLAWRVAGEALRPVGWPWLRLLLVVEAGNVYAQPEDLDLSGTLFSVGLGVRVRVSYFVNLELELGVARGFGSGGQTRVFGGGV